MIIQNVNRFFKKQKTIGIAANQTNLQYGVNGQIAQKHVVEQKLEQINVKMIRKKLNRAINILRVLDHVSFLFF